MLHFHGEIQRHRMNAYDIRSVLDIAQLSLRGQSS